MPYLDMTPEQLEPRLLDWFGAAWLDTPHEELGVKNPELLKQPTYYSSDLQYFTPREVLASGEPGGIHKLECLLNGAIVGAR